MYVIDAFGHGAGDIEAWNSTPFPQYDDKGTGVIYLEFLNSSGYPIKFTPVPSESVWTITVSDNSGFPGSKCATAALQRPDYPPYYGSWVYLAFGSPYWTPYNDKVTIPQYTIAPEFSTLEPGEPMYIQVFCYK
jgi:hypothetical protein